jgi:hypothetical protein
MNVPQSYVPVTMDELMNRFLLNLHRNETTESFNNKRKAIDKCDFHFNHLHDAEVKAVVDAPME